MVVGTLFRIECKDSKHERTSCLFALMCTHALFTLRAKLKGRGKAAQLRASSGRLITDLEMNSTYRGAVEISNLCRNLDQRGVLNAECIRTFGEDTIDGRSWMNHLESSQAYMQNQESSVSTYIPPTRKPNVRTRHSRVNECLLS